MRERGWTPEKITETILKGDKYEAPNKPNPGNTATRYQNSETGDFVVVDDTTNEILQISDKRFEPSEVPKKNIPKFYNRYFL